MNKPNDSKAAPSTPVSAPQETLEKKSWTVRWVWLKGEMKGQRGNSQPFKDEDAARALFEEYATASNISNVELVRTEVYLVGQEETKK